MTLRKRVAQQTVN